MPKLTNADSRRAELGSILDDEVKTILGIMQELETLGQSVVAGGASIELSEAKKQSLMNQIRSAAVVTDGKVKAWLAPAMAEIYVSSMNEQDKLLAKFGIDTKGGKITVEVLKAAPDLASHLAAVNSLISDTYMDFGSGLTGWVKGNEHIFNDIIRKQIQSKISLGKLTGEAVQEIKKEIVSVLQKQGLQSLIDRGGREWTLDRYSEMLTRTHLIKANTEAAVNRAQEFEVDLVEVSVHGTEDSLCLQYEGNIYSLSGKSSQYDRLPEFPPFHPNCKHTLLPRPDLQF